MGAWLWVWLESEMSPLCQTFKPLESVVLKHPILLTVLTSFVEGWGGGREREMEGGEEDGERERERAYM